MSLKENLLAELQKLRISREKPKVLQQKEWAKQAKGRKAKLLDEAKDLLAGLEELDES
jgi:hypothetical protein